MPAAARLRPTRVSPSRSAPATRTVRPTSPNTQPNNQQNQGAEGPEGEGGRRNRRRRGRDRAAVRPAGPGGGAGLGQGQGQRNEPDTTILEDDVLVPAAGILDVLDNYAFVRTSGYLPGVDDVYLSLSMVRKYGLRRGDAVVGQVRQPRDGRAQGEVQPDGAHRQRQRDRPGVGADPARLRHDDPALPLGATAPRDRTGQPHRSGHRPRRADRQGPARPDRVASQGRQDHGPSVGGERRSPPTTPSVT